jgi:hypothetical protein
MPQPTSEGGKGEKKKKEVRVSGLGSVRHTSAYVSIRQRQHTSAHVSIRQHTSAYVSIRQHTLCVRLGASVV